MANLIEQQQQPYSSTVPKTVGGRRFCTTTHGKIIAAIFVSVVSSHGTAQMGTMNTEISA
jgi:hypothetical protein